MNLWISFTVSFVLFPQHVNLGFASLAIHHFKRSSRAQQLLSTLAVIYSVESRNSESSFTPIKVKVDTWFSKYTCKYLHLTAKYLALTATGTWGSNIFSQFARMFCDFCHFFSKLSPFISCLCLKEKLSHTTQAVLKQLQ